MDAFYIFEWGFWGVGVERKLALQLTHKIQNAKNIFKNRI